MALKTDDKPDLKQHYNDSFNGIADNYNRETDHPLGERETKAESDTAKPTYKSDGSKPETDWYKNAGEDLKNTKFSVKGFKKNAKAIYVAFGVIGLVVAIGAMFSLLSGFKLDNLMKNIEYQSFRRYQVSMDNRSTKWLQAYMIIRMGEIDNGSPDAHAGNRDNIVFRANRVDNNNPLTDWYKTMRTSRFEADLAEKYGIKFASVAESLPNGGVRFRPGYVLIKDMPITFDLTELEIKTIEDFDVNGLNGRLNEFVHTDVFENNKEARKAIKQAVNENTHWYQFVKRHSLRKNIQNMTGVRDWRFFEKTRDKIGEKKIAIRNRVVMTALPESTKTGKFVQCLFGIISCRGSVDPNNPENRAGATRTPNGDRDQRQATNPDGTPAENPDGTPIMEDAGDASRDLEVDLNGSDGSSDNLMKFFVGQIIKKINLAVGIASFLDTVARVDKNIKNGSLIKLVAVAKAAQAVGLLQVGLTAADQIKTGEITGEELNEFMGMFQNVSNNEGWQTAVTQATGSAKAQSEEVNYKYAVNREEYCGDEHQILLQDPKFRNQAEKEYHYLCDAQKVGGQNNTATSITEWWNRILGPFQGILEVYRNTGGKIFSFLEGIADKILGPVMNAFLSVTGLEDDIQKMVGWLMGKIASALGAGPMYSGQEPTGVLVNIMVQGGGVMAESSARQQGGVRTTAVTAQYTDNLLANYEKEFKESQSFYEKHFAFSNFESTASKTVFSYISDVNTADKFGTTTGILSNVAKTPLAFFNGKAKAQGLNSNPRSMAEFAGYQTFEIPQVCQDMDILTMQPSDMTNADNMGFINPDELTWGLVRDNASFWDRIYPEILKVNDNDPDSIALDIYNCASFDNAVSGGLGGIYGYKTPDDYGEESIVSDTEDTGDEVGSTICNDTSVNKDIYWPTSPHPHRNNHDITVQSGTSVYSITSGTVVESKDLVGCDGRNCEDGMYSYGRFIKINHGSLGVVSYAHLNERKAKVGDKVSAGQLIGISGKSGNTSGPHLHIDVNSNETLIPWLRSNNAKEPPNPACTAINKNIDRPKYFTYVKLAGGYSYV